MARETGLRGRGCWLSSAERGTKSGMSSQGDQKSLSSMRVLTRQTTARRGSYGRDRGCESTRREGNSRPSLGRWTRLNSTNSTQRKNKRKRHRHRKGMQHPPSRCARRRAGTRTAPSLQSRPRRPPWPRAPRCRPRAARRHSRRRRRRAATCASWDAGLRPCSALKRRSVRDGRQLMAKAGREKAKEEGRSQLESETKSMNKRRDEDVPPVSL